MSLTNSNHPQKGRELEWDFLLVLVELRFCPVLLESEIDTRDEDWIAGAMPSGRLPCAINLHVEGLLAIINQYEINYFLPNHENFGNLQIFNTPSVFSLPILDLTAQIN